MPDSDAGSDELLQLRSRVYGPAGAQPVTQVDITRLQQLEHSRATARIQGEDVPDGAETSPGAPSGDTDQEQQSTPPSQPPGSERRQPRKWRNRALLAAVSVLLVLAGFTIGVAVTAPQSTAGTLPELGWPQTEEDLLPAAASGVLTPSSRFIARVDGFDVYLALPAGYEGICVITVRLDDAVSLTTGCGGGSVNDGGVAVEVSNTLTIEVGNAGLPAQGNPVRLSESVTAYER